MATLLQRKELIRSIKGLGDENMKKKEIEKKYPLVGK